MSQRKIKIIQPEDQVRVMFGAGDEYRFLATGDDTDGAYFLVEAIVPPGGGPSPHIQTREEEAFYILEGAKHSFRNNTDQAAKMLFFFTPAGIEKLFDEFDIMDEPASDLDMAITGLNTLGSKYGVQYFSGQE